MDSDSTFDAVFDLEAELRAIEGDLGRERREFREELTAAFRRLNAEVLHDADQRTYPLTTPEKQAVRRETVGPVRLLPEWEQRYRNLAEDQRTARERLADFHRDVFTELAADEPYDLAVETRHVNLGEPYLDLRVRDDDTVVVLEIDNPVTEGYVYRRSPEYTERDVENALRLCEDIEEVAVERLGFLTYDTALVDYAATSAGLEDPEAIRKRVQVAVLEALEELDYEYLRTEESPVLTFLETRAEYGLGD